MDITIDTIKTLNRENLHTFSVAELEALEFFVRVTTNDIQSKHYRATITAARTTTWETTPEALAAQQAFDLMLQADQDYQALVAIREPLYKEYIRQRRNATRAANEAARAAIAIPAGAFVEGEEVMVHAFGRWYNGVITKMGRTGKAHVTYTVASSGRTYNKAVASDKIRKKNTPA